MADLKDKILKLDEYLGKQRLDWTDKIKGLTVELKLGNQLEQVSSYSLSYRQILVENLASMSIRIRAQKTSVDQKYKTKWIEYYTYDYKLTDKQREKFLLADLAEDNQLLDLLETQKSFFEATVKTLDNMGFAIKNRLDMTRI
jgi:hypothetical protein